MGRDESDLDRKRRGAYYTPPDLVAYVVRHTLGPLLAGRTPEQIAGLRVLDPACGDGAFLQGAYDFLIDWYGRYQGRVLSAGERQEILQRHLFGVEVDETAAEAARRSLDSIAGGVPLSRKRKGTDENIRTSNALVTPDFDAAGIQWDGPFDVVLGNPPWGQKAIPKDAALKRYLWQRYPSSAGIFDLFRPFVELGVRLTADGGRFGMVLPDIVLLKDYPQTRLLLLDQLSLERIDWWGRAFAGAMIDTTTIIGSKRPAPPRHRVAVAVHDEPPLSHTIPQADFRANPRYVFNLHLTAKRRRLLKRLSKCPRLGDFFEVHEGVHSGNLRAELFVDTAVDESCRELLFGRDEIIPYRLRWHGGFIRLGALPQSRTPTRYANVGRRGWHERKKLLVRRTGDRVLAAVDHKRRYASNNFFLVFPKRDGSLDLDGLCALLNSRFMTWYFRTIEPRRGRVFAELKIKHLRTFPLPPGVAVTDGCQRLNELGRRRRTRPNLDAEIDAAVSAIFGIGGDGIE